MRGRCWTIRSARDPVGAVVGTQIVATPIGWDWAGFVWAYAFAWFFVNDRIKLLAYRIFDPQKG